MADCATKKMLQAIREAAEQNKNKKPDLNEGEVNLEKDNFLTRSKILMEEAEKKKINEEENNHNDDKHQRVFPITKKTPQFSDVRVSQEDALIKTIGEQVKTDEESLLYYPDANDLVFNGEIPILNLSFQFRLNDSAEGLYIWCDALQLTENNSRTLGKIRDAFLNWRSALVQDGDLMEKLKKVSERNE